MPAAALDLILAAMAGNRLPKIVPEWVTDMASGAKYIKAASPEALRTLGRDDDPAMLGALKHLRIPPEGPDHDRVMARFRAEVSALREVDHPAILRVLDADVEAAAMVTEFHPNGTLEHDRRFVGLAAEALEAVHHLADGLAELHRRGHVHRDIKPPNIFVSRANELVLGDFGIVFYADEMRPHPTEAHERVGSRDWMAPWTHTGDRVENVGPAADVFSLGKVRDLRGASIRPRQAA